MKIRPQLPASNNGASMRFDNVPSKATATFQLIDSEGRVKAETTSLHDIYTFLETGDKVRRFYVPDSNHGSWVEETEHVMDFKQTFYAPFK